MHVSVRSYLMAGVAAVGAVAVVLPPLHVPLPDITVDREHRPTTSSELTDLLEAAQRTMEPFLAKPQHTALPPGVTALPDAQPRVTAVPGPLPAPPAPPSPGAAPLNAAGDVLTSAYEYIQRWVDWGVDTAIWATGVFGWVPFVPLAGAQIDLFYYHLIRPIANDVVYELLEPVLNDPLNLGVWIDSAANTLEDTVVTAVNFAIAEFDYFFGWALPPLPPIGPATVQDEVYSAALLETAGEVEPPGVETLPGAVGEVVPSSQEKTVVIDMAPGTEKVHAAAEIQPDTTLAVDPAPVSPDPAAAQETAAQETAAPVTESALDTDEPAVTKPRRPGQRVSASLRKAADDVRASVRGSVTDAAKAASRFRDAITPKRRSDTTAAGTAKDAHTDTDDTDKPRSGGDGEGEGSGAE